MLTESGITVQNADGSKEAVSLKEAIERLAAKPPERQALYVLLSLRSDGSFH